MHTFLHTYILTCLHPYILTSLHAYMLTYLHSYILTCLHTYIHTCIHIYIHTCIHACIHTYIHTYLHTYIHTSIHPYIRTYIHTYMCFLVFGGCQTEKSTNAPEYSGIHDIFFGPRPWNDCETLRDQDLAGGIHRSVCLNCRECHGPLRRPYYEVIAGTNRWEAWVRLSARKSRLRYWGQNRWKLHVFLEGPKTRRARFWTPLAKRKVAKGSLHPQGPMKTTNQTISAPDAKDTSRCQVSDGVKVVGAEVPICVPSRFLRPCPWDPSRCGVACWGLFPFVLGFLPEHVWCPESLPLCILLCVSTCCSFFVSRLIFKTYFGYWIVLVFSVSVCACHTFLSADCRPPSLFSPYLSLSDCFSPLLPTS